MADAVPFEARHAMQKALWECLRYGHEWTTWTDAIALAEEAARALTEAGFQVQLIDGEIRDQDADQACRHDLLTEDCYGDLVCGRCGWHPHPDDLEERPKAWRAYLFGVLPFGPRWAFPLSRGDVRRPWRWLTTVRRIDGLDGAQ